MVGESTRRGSCDLQMTMLSDDLALILCAVSSISGVGKPYHPRLVPGDFIPYYNGKTPYQMINEWFAKGETSAA